LEVLKDCKVLHKHYELTTELNSIILHKIELSSHRLFLAAFYKALAQTFISGRLKTFVSEDSYKCFSHNEKKQLSWVYLVLVSFTFPSQKSFSPLLTHFLIIYWISFDQSLVNLLTFHWISSFIKQHTR